MRTWDIVDTLDGTEQITKRARGAKLVGSASSLVKNVLIVSVAFASSSFPSSCVKQSQVAAFGIPVHWKKAAQSVSSGRLTRGALRDTDTQYGQSSSKLARSFTALFKPAADEVEDEDDNYSFA